MVYYEAALTVPESKTTEEIENIVTSAVQNADPTQFTSFDSFDSFSVIVEETNQETTSATTTSGTTTPAKSTTKPTKAVLIMSTNRPLLIDFEGERELIFGKFAKLNF